MSKVDPAELPVAIGQVIAGRYAVSGILGKGGMGIVAAGKHLELGEKVAIKFLHKEHAGHADRFFREAQAAARIKSEHVVPDLRRRTPHVRRAVHRHGASQGEDVAERLTRLGRMDAKPVADLLIDVCHALAEAHAVGIVHRDLKPCRTSSWRGARARRRRRQAARFRHREGARGRLAHAHRERARLALLHVARAAPRLEGRRRAVRRLEPRRHSLRALDRHAPLRRRLARSSSASSSARSRRRARSRRAPSCRPPSMPSSRCAGLGPTASPTSARWSARSRRSRRRSCPCRSRASSACSRRASSEASRSRRRCRRRRTSLPTRSRSRPRRRVPRTNTGDVSVEIEERPATATLNAVSTSAPTTTQASRAAGGARGWRVAPSPRAPSSRPRWSVNDCSRRRRRRPRPDDDHRRERAACTGKRHARRERRSAAERDSERERGAGDDGRGRDTSPDGEASAPAAERERDAATSTRRQLHAAVHDRRPRHAPPEAGVHVMRRLAGAGFVLVFCLAAPAWADDGNVCKESYEEAQVLMRPSDGTTSLLPAREKLRMHALELQKIGWSTTAPSGSPTSSGAFRRSCSRRRTPPVVTSPTSRSRPRTGSSWPRDSTGMRPRSSLASKYVFIGAGGLAARRPSSCVKANGRDGLRDVRCVAGGARREHAATTAARCATPARVSDDALRRLCARRHGRGRHRHRRHLRPQRDREERPRELRWHRRV